MSSLALVAAGVAAYLLLLRDEEKNAPAAPPTAVVRRGDVRATVAGVGTLQPEKSVSLGFGEGGRVKSVEVHLGQKVKAGQVLARLDDTLPRASLDAARSQVSAAEAKVDQLLEGHTPQELDKVGTEATVARRAITVARRTAAKARKVAAGEVKSLRTAVTQARNTHRVAVKRLAQNRSKLGKKKGRVATAKSVFLQAKATVEADRTQIVALAGTREANRKKAEEEEAKERRKLEEDEKKEREKAEEEGKEFRGKEASVIQRNPETGTSYAEAQAQSRLETAQSDLTEAQAAYEKFRSEVETLRTSSPDLRDTVRSSGETAATAKAALRTGTATAAQNVRTSKEAVETARSTLKTTLAAGAVEVQPPKSGEMAEAISAISQAESTVATSEKSLEETVLRAPAAGRVANLKLAVGDVVSGGQTSQAKAGSSTGGEGGEGGSSEGGSGEGEVSSAGGSSSGGPSIVLTSPQLKLFAVSLTQADAIKVHPGDNARLIIDALSRTVKGRLVSITPLPAVKNGVVNYTATVATADLPQKLRIGMTAEVTIVTANRKNVPVLPPSALPAGTGTVNLQVLNGGKREERVVRLGVSGDETVEVKKGLRPGEKVLLPGQPEAGGFEEEEFGEAGFGEEEFE